MKRILIYTLFIVALTTLSSTTLTADDNYIVRPVGGHFHVYTDSNNKIVYTSDDAALSIQWALDNLASVGKVGGEILLEEGDYQLNNCIMVKSNIWLHGKGKSTNLIANALMFESILLQDAVYTVISDFSMTNPLKLGDIAIGVYHSVSCQVMNMYISGFNSGIVNDEESSLTLITENQLENNKTHIKISSGGGVLARWLPLWITHNTIKGGGMGIYCKAMVTNIMYNTISDLNDIGINAATNSIIVRGNTISNVKGEFAIFGTGAEFNCTDNIISDVQGGGIRTRGRWGTVTDNRITNCGTEQKPAIGILVITDDAKDEGPAESKVIYRNTIVNDPNHVPLEHGIKEDGFTSIISGNIIKNFSKEAILSIGKGTLVKNNTINSTLLN